MSEKTMMPLRTLMSSLIKRKKFDGKEYLVVPTVLMAEGVHNNILYPAEELSKVPDAWNGRPVVVYHPQINGQHVTANDPTMWEKRKVGFVFNAKWDDALKKLMADCYVDPEKAEEVEPKVLKALNDGHNLEVSTGLFTEDEMKANAGDATDTWPKWNEEAYNLIARNHRPDHLAILPDQKGACSWEDGAGMPRCNVQDAPEAVKCFDLRVNKKGGKSFNDIQNAVQKAVALVFKSFPTLDMPYPPGPWVAELYEDRAVVEFNNTTWNVPYTWEGEEAVVDKAAAVEVVRKTTYVPKVLHALAEEKGAEIIKVLSEDRAVVEKNGRRFIVNGGPGSGNFGHSGGAGGGPGGSSGGGGGG